MEVFEAHRRRVELLALSAIPSDTDLFDQSVGAPESRDPAADPGSGHLPASGSLFAADRHAAGREARGLADRRQSVSYVRRRTCRRIRGEGVSMATAQ